MKPFYTLLLLLFVLNNLSAQQNHQIDSLKVALKSAKNAADKLSTYDLLANKMAYSNADSALLISNEYLNLAIESKDEVRITKAKNTRGLCYFLNSDYKNASIYFIQAIKEFEKQGDKYNVAVALNNLAASYEHIESPEATIKNFKKAHEIFKEIKNTKWIGISAGNLSNNYLQKLNDLPNAEKYAKIAVESAKITGEKTRQAEASLTLGNVLFTAKKYTEAANAYDNVTKLVNADSYPLLFGSARVNQGSCLNETADYESAIRVTNEAKEVFTKQKSWLYVNIAWQGLIEIYQRKNDFKLA
ncbi:MAG: tetratricopeptide repeat protein [Emticicia sp.]|nr:tetratricopeptide repeat protein [Emticicia sp.]